MNELIDRNAVMSLRGHLIGAAPGRAFDHVERAVTRLDPLNLRARSDLISDALVADLPDDYAEVAAIFRMAIDDPGFDGWMLWPVTETSGFHSGSLIRIKYFSAMTFPSCRTGSEPVHN